MKKLIFLILLTLFAYFSNPDVEDHQRAVKNSVMEMFVPSSDELGGVVPLYTKVVADISAYGLSSVFVERKDYYLFSITQIEGITIGIGMFNNVIVFDNKLKKIIKKYDE